MRTHFRIEIKALSKASGQSAAAVCRYDTRESHRDKSDLVMTGAINMPSWAVGDVSTFWDAADEFERANGLVSRRAILSFPNQLLACDREKYIRDWLLLNCPNMPASWAVHDNQNDEPRNPHCHILISERQVDGVERPPELFFKRYNAKTPGLGGCKKADIGSNRKEWLGQARISWADILNRDLPANQQVSHLSNEERGLPDPQPKFGARVLAAEKKGIRTKLVSSVLEDSATTNKIRCLSFIDQTGKTITYRSCIDRGDSIEIVGKVNRSKVIDIVKACREKGWHEVELSGSDEFKQMARDELLLAGIKIKGEHNEQNQPDDSRSTNGSGEQRRTGRTERPAQSSTADVGNSRSDEGCERAQQQANQDAAGTAGSAHPEKTARPLDRLGDHRRYDICDIAASYHPSKKPVINGLPTSKGRNDMSKDLTAIAVQKQLDVLVYAQNFEIGIFNMGTGKMMFMKASAGQILDQIPRLKRENARGNNIYIRPDRSSIHPYVLLDDLGDAQLAKLEAEGFFATLILETSPDNYQVLLKLPQPTDAAGRKQIERTLQQRFGSDPGCADGQHLFRVAGFTNRKPKHEKNGRFPYVKVIHARAARLSSNALELLYPASHVMAVPENKPERVIKNAFVTHEWTGKAGDLASMVAMSHNHLLIRYGAAYDPSTADFQIAKTLLAQGWDSKSVIEGLRASSPNLSVRKAGHVDDYLNRTISSVTDCSVVNLEMNRPSSPLHRC